MGIVVVKRTHNDEEGWNAAKESKPDLRLGRRYNLMTQSMVNRLMGVSAGKHVKA